MSREGLAFIHDTNNCIGRVRAYNELIKSGLSVLKYNNPDTDGISDDIKEYIIKIDKQLDILIDLNDNYYEIINK